jgi:hypothetical protein
LRHSEKPHCAEAPIDYFIHRQALIACIALCAVQGIRENPAIASINRNYLVAPVNMVGSVSRQRFAVFDVAPQNKDSLIVEDALHVILSDDFAELEARFGYADGGFGNGTDIVTHVQEIKVCERVRYKQLSVIPSPEIYPLRTAVIFPSGSQNPACFIAKLHRSIWAFDTQRELWPQLTYSESGLRFLQLALHGSYLLVSSNCLFRSDCGEIARGAVSAAQRSPLEGSDYSASASHKEKPDGGPYDRITEGMVFLLFCFAAWPWGIIRIWYLYKAANYESSHGGNEGRYALIGAILVVVGWLAGVYGGFLLVSSLVA